MMKLLIREKAREFVGSEFTAEMVLGTEPLPEGIIKSMRESVILSETYTDPKSGHLKHRKPRERVLEHWYFVRTGEGEKRKIFIGDFVLKGRDGKFSVLSKEGIGNYDMVEVPGAKAEVRVPVEKVKPPTSESKVVKPKRAMPAGGWNFQKKKKIEEPPVKEALGAH